LEGGGVGASRVEGQRSASWRKRKRQGMNWMIVKIVEGVSL
jgi:hypothetical protein